MNPILYRYKDTESVIKVMDGYTPGDGWEPLYDQAAMDAALSAPTTAPEQEASVKQVDANNYCLILRLLGMEEEGDPVAEVERLRKDSERMREALTFYAEGDHFTFDRDAWDTVSDEPQNYWCDEAGTATVEDGTIAKLALDAAMKGTP